MNNNRKILIIGSMVLLILLVILMLVFQKKPPTKTEELSSTVSSRVQSTPIPTLIPHPTLGSMTISAVGGVIRFPNNKELSVLISSSSEGKNIVAYDAILSFDKSAFTYVKTASQMSDFNVFSYERPTYLSMSAIKSLQNNKSTPWNKQPLVEVVFKPKKTGTYIFMLSPMGKETSKLVDDKANVVYPKTDKLELEIY